VKESSFGDYKKYSPEFEDCKKVAQELKIPLSKVYDAVNKAILILKKGMKMLYNKFFNLFKTKIWHKSL